MDYRSCLPSACLQPYIRCYWSVTGSGSSDAPADTVVPDGCAELILNAGDRTDQVTREAARTQPRAMVVGEVRRAVVVRLAGAVDLFGIRLTPVGLRTILRVPAHELVDGAHDLLAVADAQLRAGLVQVLDEAPERRAAHADRVLAERIRTQRELDTLVWRVALTMEATDGRCSVAQLAARAGITSRQLERRFLVQVGVPPRALRSVLRFRRVLASLSDRSPAWSHVAAACGYHDQPHLIRDFKRYAGAAPRAFLGDEHPFGDLFLPGRA